MHAHGTSTSSSPGEPVLQEFVGMLLREQGTDQLDLDADVRAQLERDLLSRVQDRVNAVIIDAMPEGKREEFSQLLETGTAQEVRRFSALTVPDLDQRVAQELLSFRRTYLGTN